MADQTIIWRQSPNFDAGRGGQTLNKIIIHSTEGGFDSSLGWLCRPEGNSSAHYLISADGSRVAQMVRETDTAWHCGNYTWNQQSIGIEHEGYASVGVFSDALYRASAKLVAHICTKFGIVPGYRTTLFAHAQVPNQDHTDPGPGWDWPKYLRFIQEEIKPVEPFNPNPKNLNVGTGMLTKLREIRQAALTPERYTSDSSSQLVASGNYVLFANKTATGPEWEVVAVRGQ